MAGTDGVVQGRDALVVGGAGVGHLGGRLAHQVQFAFERGVQQEGQRVEAHLAVVARLAGDLEGALLGLFNDGLDADGLLAGHWVRLELGDIVR